MFESDDFDQVLSQFEFPEDAITEATSLKTTTNCNIFSNNERESPAFNCTVELQSKSCLNNISQSSRRDQTSKIKTNENINISNTVDEKKDVNNTVSPKHMKRKIINSYFDHKSKRKFPGPAGLLTASGIGDNKDENICQIELLSQDVDFTQNGLREDLFDSPLWMRLLEDVKAWNLHDIDTIKAIKQQAITGSLKRRKAHTITAFVETIDRSATDPLIIMRDITGNIQGTLHREAWSTFSKYIASEYCAFILWKPTILTTGGAFKKHYVNITLSNILAIYSSTVLADGSDNRPLPDGYAIVYEKDYTVIKTQNNLNYLGGNDTINNGFDNNDSDLLDELDNIFSDEIF